MPFTIPNFSFRQLTDKYPELAGEITDCLSGDVNKDFSQALGRGARVRSGARRIAVWRAAGAGAGGGGGMKHQRRGGT
jgi:hypothetical protein